MNLYQAKQAASRLRFSDVEDAVRWNGLQKAFKKDGFILGWDYNEDRAVAMSWNFYEDGFLVRPYQAKAIANIVDAYGVARKI